MDDRKKVTDDHREDIFLEPPAAPSVSNPIFILGAAVVWEEDIFIMVPLGGEKRRLYPSAAHQQEVK